MSHPLTFNLLPGPFLGMNLTSSGATTAVQEGVMVHGNQESFGEMTSLTASDSGVANKGKV